MVSSFMMTSSICSHFSPLRNSPSRESADEHFLSLLGSMITLYLTFKYVSLSKNPSMAENEVFQEHQSRKLQRNSKLVINEQ